MMKSKKDNGLDPESYRHPLETRSLENLKKTKGLQLVINKFHDIGIEENLRIQYQSSSIKANTNNFSHLVYLMERAADVLQPDLEPDLYIHRSDRLEGISLGVEKPMIIISSHAVDKLSSQELLFIIGREIAHISHQHTLYKEIDLIFPDLIEAFSVVTLGLSSIVSAGLRYALYQWDRMSEYTADRGGLLACQDRTASLSILAKLAGWPERNWNSISFHEFEAQAKSFDAGPQKAFDKIIGYMLGNNSWALARAKELIDWTSSDAEGYKDLLKLMP